MKNAAQDSRRDCQNTSIGMGVSDLVFFKLIIMTLLSARNKPHPTMKEQFCLYDSCLYHFAVRVIVNRIN